MLFFIFLLLISSFVKPTVHVIGDSHAGMYCVNKRNPRFLLFKDLQLHALAGTTMHRVGRDNLGSFYIKHYDVKNQDQLLFVFGEIDVRCHIGRIRDIQERTLENVIDELTNKYISTITLIRELLSNTKIIISGVVPPSNQKYNPDFPYYGTLKDRINITILLNSTLKIKCSEQGLYYIDAYTPFCNTDGSLMLSMSDGVHVSSRYNQYVLEQLLAICEL